MPTLIQFPQKRLFVISGMLLISSMACQLSIAGLTIGAIEPDETELAQNVNATLTAVIATEYADSTATSLAEPTSTPTSSPTPSLVPSQTSTPTLEATPTPEGLFIGEISLSVEVDDNNLPISPSSTFKQGVNRIYASFPYSGMEPGMQVKFYWELNGKEWYTSVITWDGESAGNYSRYIHYVDESALDPGKWAVKVYIDGTLIQTGRWVIQ